MKYLAILIFFVCYSLAADKNWKNYKANNLRNWNNEISVHGLFFSTNIQNPMAFYSPKDDFCQLVIPMNSDENDTNFEWTPISEGEPLRCPDQESGDTYWIDPRNWDSTLVTNATPHMERLPCAYESVSFEKGRSDDLYVILPDKPIQVRRIYWNNKYISSYNVNSTIQSDDFLKHFMITGSKNFWEMILISSGYCSNQTGCECGNYQFYKETCKLLRDECSSQLACSNPVKPSGHCCYICGCYLRILFNPYDFIYKKLEAVVKNFFDGTKFTYHLSRISGDYVQLVIIKSEETDDDHNDLFDKIEKLQSLLLSDDPSLSHLSQSILEIDPYCSMGINDPHYFGLKSWSHLLLPIFGIASFIIFAFLVYQSKISQSKLQALFKSSFSFMKFDNQMDKVEDDEQSQSDEQQQQQQQQQQQGNSENKESENIEPELHSEEKSEKGSSSELDDDSVLVELS